MCVYNILLHLILIIFPKENIDEIATETYRLDYKFTICMKELNSVLKSGPFAKADKAYVRFFKIFLVKSCYKIIL